MRLYTHYIIYNNTVFPLRRRWGFWVHNGVFERGQPYTLAIVSESSGRRVATTITDVFKGQELKVQF
jgi:hypothetical protein